MTPLSRFLMMTAVKGEALFARIFARHRVARNIIAYNGYATADHLIVMGRVQASLRNPVPQEHHSRLRNLRDMLSLFLTSEVAHAKLIVDGTPVEADDEGYFMHPVPRGGRTGIEEVVASLAEMGETQVCPVFAPVQTGRALVICDIDDTILRTGAYSLVRNLWNSFTGNVLTRHVFPDAAKLLRALHHAAHPVFFVSSSPWNLFSFLKAIFDRAGVPAGPMFLRDMGLSETKFITEGHGNHKGNAIDTVLAANPERQAILIGDTGQKDAQIYRAAIDRHPGRISSVILRVQENGLDASDRADLLELQKTGVTILHGPDFDDVMKDDAFSHLKRT